MNNIAVPPQAPTFYYHHIGNNSTDPNWGLFAFSRRFEALLVRTLRGQMHKGYPLWIPGIGTYSDAT